MRLMRGSAGRNSQKWDCLSIDYEKWLWSRYLRKFVRRFTVQTIFRADYWELCAEATLVAMRRFRCVFSMCIFIRKEICMLCIHKETYVYAVCICIYKKRYVHIVCVYSSESFCIQRHVDGSDKRDGSDVYLVCIFSYMYKEICRRLRRERHAGVKILKSELYSSLI